MRKLLMIMGLAVLTSCETTPLVKEIPTDPTTTTREYEMTTADSTYKRLPFDELNHHSWDSTTMIVSYTHGVNNQPFYMEMDSYEMALSNKSIKFIKTQQNGTVITLIYYNDGQVSEWRTNESIGYHKGTIFSN